MRCFQVISIILGFASLSTALPQVLPYRSAALSRRHVATKQAVSATDLIVHEDFLLSGFFSSKLPGLSQGSFNHSLYFTFEDPNSGTETFCSKTWIDTTNSSGAPFGPSYLLCDQTPGANGKPEAFDWFIKSYTDLCHFSLELAHDFSDPV
ncbi:hypothetical protein BDZ45DRAFT_88747 [Acephala macrosclerotiorum]|nr:hypothetical protein BDZ45DRAFT_88747 [Acephala macrosclerotiorum]